MARVGFDIDGVLYPFEVEFHKYAFRVADDYECKCLPVSTWNFYEEWGFGKDWFIDKCNEGVNAGELFWHGIPYKDTRGQLDRILDAGHDLVFITSRDYGAAGVSETATRSWLLEEFGLVGGDYELHLTQDKTTVQVDYFIDDNMDHARAMWGAGVKTWLCSRPWNEGIAAMTIGAYRGTLEEYVDKVLDIEERDKAADAVSLGRKPEAQTQECWTCERNDVLDRFAEELEKATGDGSRKRQAGEKPPWYRDDSHEGAIFSHLTKWKRGELVDPDSGAHPLVHAAWRCLAIACRESGNHPQ